MKHVLLVFGAVAAGICCATAQSPLSVTDSAQRLALCTMAFDAGCVIDLSEAEIYNQLGSQNSDFESAQARFFEALKRSGRGYVRFEVKAPWPEFSKQGVEYVFVPYTSQLEGLPELNAYLVGISRDNGDFWKFVDGCHITSENIQTVIPGYEGEHRPPADKC